MDKPSIFTQLYNFGKATITHVAAGLPAVNDEELAKRVEICSTCPNLDTEQFRCNVCGCFLKYKTAWAKEKCPEGKW